MPPKRPQIGTYIDPLSDFGFKRLFFGKPGKSMLIAFLNGLLEGKKVISDLEYNNNEQLGETTESRNVLFDLVCTAQDGEQFIVEVQRIRQSFFKDRALFYATKLIQGQAPKQAKWNYVLKEVYFIGILDFLLDGSPKEDFLHRVRLAYEKTGGEFYGKLKFIFVEIPKFVKTEPDLVTNTDKWLFVLKNMSRLKRLPSVLKTDVFVRLFRLAQVANLSKNEYMRYEKDLMAKWDQYALIESAKEIGFEKGREEGREEGREQGREEEKKLFVRNLLQNSDFTIRRIAFLAGVSESFVRKEKKNL